MKKWNDYFIDGTDVMKNKLNITNYEELEYLETMITAAKATSLLLPNSKSLTSSYNLERLKQIHKYLFEDIYNWAGELRNVDMNKHNQFYYPYHNIILGANELLVKPDFKKVLEVNDVAKLLAESFLNVNIIHPFREGNTRTNIIFHIQMAKEYGYLLNIFNLDYKKLSIAKWKDQPNEVTILFKNNLLKLK